MAQYQGYFFWGFLVVFGLVMFIISPSAKTEGSFYKGQDNVGRPPSGRLLTVSIFISWIFAKSVTNAANLGYTYGIVGGIAYAAYWLCIPVAGIIIYRMRTRQNATGIVSFLSSKYGRPAAVAFSAAILVRLYNEVWSNTAVVSGFYGAQGSKLYIGAASLFTLVVLLYSLKGGLRSSIYTDISQTVVFVLFLGLILALVLPSHNMGTLMTEGSFTLAGGVDLLLVALLQILSYPFHDPVLTDRGFLTDEKTMLRAFISSGILGFIAIAAFSLIGIHARLENMPPSSNVPATIARTLGFAGSFAMLAIMITSAASTLDSTFSSLSKLVGKELPMLANIKIKKPVAVGLFAMVVFAIVGNLPMLAGTDILKATTISGTMVIGLAPVFILSRWADHSPLSFHLSFWCGMALGFAYVFGWIPQSWAIGEGRQALLLGVNLYGLILCFAGFILPIAVGKLFKGKVYDVS